jgi:hypothetical protein
MTHLLRCLITVLAVAGLASPSIAPRQARGRSSGFSRGQRVRSASHIDRSYSHFIRGAAERQVPAFDDRGQGDTPAAVLIERVRWPTLIAASELIHTPEFRPLFRSARTNLGRAPPL